MYLLLVVSSYTFPASRQWPLWRAPTSLSVPSPSNISPLCLLQESLASTNPVRLPALWPFARKRGSRGHSVHQAAVTRPPVVPVRNTAGTRSRKWNGLPSISISPSFLLDLPSRRIRALRSVLGCFFSPKKVINFFLLSDCFLFFWAIFLVLFFWIERRWMAWDRCCRLSDGVPFRVRPPSFLCACCCEYLLVYLRQSHVLKSWSSLNWFTKIVFSFSNYSIVPIASSW